MKKCLICERIADQKEFDGYPQVFREEYRISGMCPGCQLQFFLPEPNEDCEWRGDFCTHCKSLRGVSDCPNCRQPNPSLVCIYPQEAWHDDAFIIGNRGGLLSLQKAITKALETGKGSEGVFVQDGEGYEVRVLLNDHDWLSDEWRRLMVPYTADYAGEKTPTGRKDIIGPEALWQQGGDEA